MVFDQLDRPTVPFQPRGRRPLFSARKFVLMASVVAGLGVAVYGFDALSGDFNVLSTQAHAQVNTDVGKVAQPIGFADVVRRVKPSVISVKP